MSGQARRNAVVWVAGWGIGVLVLLVALPLAASSRLPDRIATHWRGSGRPDGSMPLWAAALFPALIWGVSALVVVLSPRWAGAGDAVPGWTVAGLGFGGVTLLGGQASAVRANLDHGDRHTAGSVTTGVAGTLLVATVVGTAGAAAAHRARAGARSAAAGSTPGLPAGERVSWSGRASNSWLHALAVLTGLLGITVVLSVLAGLTGPPFLVAAAPFALASVLVLGFSTVRARVDETGLAVAFGPFARPTRRWAVEDIASARVEHRRPGQVGGWGYRLGGPGTTVLVRGGECLVIQDSKGGEFAVSVDGAEHGAALLNSSRARQNA
ncbi:hypothetical protein QFZ56_007398 [Streptomyces achromogenes]|uniref:DUF1648 domain-containing protein n=1 Tax=Streptomyces achromogenes TaxID=67255 RepID=A0ABU0QCP6_STRAH|nr:DUF1648 domain-containing protein [Streptomyces achromogenes]MDQ0688435.1 hypothetical protein [Streptomyces achromogenes]